MVIGRAMLRWIEGVLAAVGVCCLFWAGTIWVSAVRYQIEHTRAVERPQPITLPADASAPIGRLTIPRLDLSAVVAEGHMVVNPEDVWVLDASSAAALTLITCYPFDFMGAAPRRFVVHAERV